MPGEANTSANEEKTVQYHSVSEGFFETLGVPLVRGRMFDERDTVDNPGVILVNEAFARRYFPGEDPVGRNIVSLAVNIGPLGSSLMADRRHQIIGVIGDVKNQSLRAPVEALRAPAGCSESESEEVRNLSENTEERQSRGRPCRSSRHRSVSPRTATMLPPGQ